MKKQTFILLLVVLALFATVLGASAASLTVDPACPDGTPSASGCNDPNTYKTIQAAIDGASATDTINVLAGTYNESITVNKALTLRGPNFGIAGRLSTRGAEAIINGTVNITASSVTVSGFTLTNPGGTYALQANNAVNTIKVSHNIVTDVGSTSTTPNVHALRFLDGADNVTIEFNLIDGVAADTYSVSAIYFGDTAATDFSNTVNIRYNVIKNIDSVTKGAYGIIFNNAAGVSGAVILHNVFESLDGGWTHAVGMEGPTPNVQIVGNSFTGLTTTPAQIDTIAIFFEDNPDGGSAEVHYNTFQESTWFGVAVAGSDVGNYTVDAENNWWNDDTGPGESTPPSGSGATGSGAFVGPSVDYDPWMIADPVTPWSQGFEAGTAGWFDYANGSIAQVASGNGYSSVASASGAYHAEISNTANGGSVFTQFGSYANVFPTGGYTAEVDIYLDPAWTDGTGFEYTVASSGSDAVHQRDFVFHVHKDTDDQKLYIGVSNNTTSGGREDLTTIPHVEITDAGWYTFRHYFTDDSGLLAVVMSVIDDTNATIFTETRTSAEDPIPAAIGGNRYGWFATFLLPHALEIDNTELCLGAGPCSPSTISTAPAATLDLCGTAQTVTIDLNNISNLYGYQFDVAYDPLIVTPDPDFVGGFFTIPGEPEASNASCGGGTCTFWVTKLNPSPPVNGSGTVAEIEFTPLAGSGGTFDMTLSNVVLTTLDGDPIGLDLPAEALEITVCGQADVSGVINLQGRTKPFNTNAINAGEVKLIDPNGDFGPYSTTAIGTNGEYSFTGIDVDPAGTDFRVEASYLVYISNELEFVNLVPGANPAIATTRLLGGDANLSTSPPEAQNQLVNILDLGCIGGDFGTPGPWPCGSGGTSNINDDSVVNIQDLAIAGGNYEKYSFLSW